jgi:hypothetical protein
MKSLIFSLILIVDFASAALAQSAADPKAIDFTARMDTLATSDGDFVNLTGNLNVKKQNADQWEDFEIDHSARASYSPLRFGGPWIFDTIGTPRIAGEAIQYGDFDGDGIGDVIDHDLKFHRGISSYPYFDSAGGSYLWMHDFPNSFIIGATDFDGDGKLDLLAQMFSSSVYISLFKGRPRFGKDSLFQYPDDSLIVPGMIRGTVAQFNPSLSPEVICYAEVRSGRHIGLLHSGVKFSDESVHWLTDTSKAPEINVQNIYATDITGDGIPDLLVSDGEYVYIFKGGDDFGTYPLTKERAYYTIPNPRLIDRTGKFLDVDGFGKYMHGLGDLSGAGVPYIMIEASLSDNVGIERTYCMIYAGGKALDSLYDGIVIFKNTSEALLDTLHSVDASGRGAAMIVHNVDPDFNHGDIDNLLSRGCDSLPHRTNPTFVVEPLKLVSTQLAMNTFPSIAKRYVKVHLISSGRTKGELAIYDLLGRTVLSRKIEIDPGENIEYFETSGLANGTYVVRISGSQIATTQSTKFIVSH